MSPNTKRKKNDPGKVVFRAANIMIFASLTTIVVLSHGAGYGSARLLQSERFGLVSELT